MQRDTVTGSRIRARRIDLGLRQADLARELGISASYLNLIEHNRRRIAGKRLVAVARALGTDVTALSQGAEAALLDGLRDALASVPDAAAGLSRAEDFAGRFPDWAALAVAQARRIAALERTVETLSDRLTHDPFLSAALHDLLSTVTAIRSTSGILVEDRDIDRDWLARFHRNLHEDGQRLAEGAQALVGYLDLGAGADARVSSPQEEFESWLAGRRFHLEGLEQGGDPDADPVPPEMSPAARQLAGRHVARYRGDAAAVPLDALRRAIEQDGADPGLLAARFGCGVSRILRRLASLPEGVGGRPVGLMMCDGSGTLTLRKPVEGFTVPRYGAACPLWPLYLALARPAAPLRAVVEHAGRRAHRFLTYALSEVAHPGGFDAPPLTTATMLILPDDTDAPAHPVGSSCQVCPRRDCPARREASVVAEAL